MKINPAYLVFLSAVSLCAQNELKLKIYLDQNQQPVLLLSGRQGVTNQIEFTHSLNASNTWQRLTNFVPSAGQEQILDPAPPTQASRYYRAVAKVAPLGPTLESALDGLDFVWTSSSEYPWSPQASRTFDGEDAAQTGTPSPGGQSWLHATVAGPGMVQFQWAFAAPASDTLRFYAYLNGAPTNVLLAELSGTQTNWQPFSLDLPGGTHVLRWEYNRAVGSTGGTGWLDEVQMILACPTNGLYDDFNFNQINGNRWQTNQSNLPQLASQRLTFAVNSGSKELLARCAGYSAVEADVALNNFSGNSWFNLCSKWFTIDGTDCIAIVGMQTDPTTSLFSQSIVAQVQAEDTGVVLWRRELPLVHNANNVHLKMGYDPVLMRVEFWSNKLAFALCPLPASTVSEPQYGRFWLQAGADGGGLANYTVDNVRIQRAYTATNPVYADVYVDRNATAPFLGTSTHPLPSIQAGIARSHNGSTIHIASRTYSEQVVVDQRRQWQHLNYLTLQGEGSPMLDGQGAACGIYVNAHQWITVTNLTITGYTNGVFVADNTELVRLNRCAVTNNSGPGVTVSAETTIIEDCTISGNAGRGLDLAAGSTNATTEVARCRIQNNGSHGVFAAAGGHIANSFITGNREGGVVIWQHGIVEANTIADNDGPGVFLSTPSTAPAVQVIGNIITGNGGVGVDATFVAGELWVRNNDLWANTHSNHTGVTNKIPDWLVWGNYSVNPEFVGAGNYHLSSNSPCINNNPNPFPTKSNDIDGEPRVQFSLADTGADETAFEEAGYTFWTLAGSRSVRGSADGTGDAARFSALLGLVVDAAGNLYVTDNHTIRKVTSGGVVTTLAGMPGMQGSADGTASVARFSYPFGVAVDLAGNVYVADQGNHTIRKITPTGAVATLAGSPGTPGSADGMGSAARFKDPCGVAVDAAGNVYVADTSNHTIRKVTSGGVVTTLAGSAGAWGIADGSGSTARFNLPIDAAMDGAGNVYVADAKNHTIRRVTSAGLVTTLAGSSGIPGSADGTVTAARFNSPHGVSVDLGGSVYVADFGNLTIRKITSAGVVTTLAGSPGIAGSTDGTASLVRFGYNLSDVAAFGAGRIYVADSSYYIIRIGVRGYQYLPDP